MKENEDLAIIYRLLVNIKENGLITNILNNHNFSCLGNISMDELHEIALDNMEKLFDYKIISLDEFMLKTFFDMELDDCEENIDAFNLSPMYVGSNNKKLNGANIILLENMLYDFSQKIGRNFYILPSSIHECIFVPEFDEIDVESLQKMVEYTNCSNVLVEDRLSNNVFYYDSDERRVKQITHNEKSIKDNN